MYIFCSFSKIIKFFLKKDLFGFSSIVIEINDIGKTVEFDWIKGMQEVKKKPEISVSSSSLNYIFKFQWGLDSLMVNGRGSYLDENCKWKFGRIFSLGLINANGKTLISRIIEKIIP